MRKIRRGFVPATVVLLLAACVNVPGETTLARAELRDVRERVLTMSRTSNPACRDHTVLNTEIVDVYSNGRSAEELWIVSQCGTRLRYVVSFPQKRTPGAFNVREHR